MEQLEEDLPQALVQVEVEQLLLLEAEVVRQPLERAWDRSATSTLATSPQPMGQQEESRRFRCP